VFKIAAVLTVTTLSAVPVKYEFRTPVVAALSVLSMKAYGEVKTNLISKAGRHRCTLDQSDAPGPLPTQLMLKLIPCLE